LKDYASIPGNQGVWVLRRVRDGKAEFTLISLWESWDAIREFAGSDYEKTRSFCSKCSPMWTTTRCWALHLP